VATDAFSRTVRFLLASATLLAVLISCQAIVRYGSPDAFIDAVYRGLGR
jgi:hypothetical protein